MIKLTPYRRLLLRNICYACLFIYLIADHAQKIPSTRHLIMTIVFSLGAVFEIFDAIKSVKEHKKQQ